MEENIETILSDEEKDAYSYFASCISGVAWHINNGHTVETLLRYAKERTKPVPGKLSHMNDDVFLQKRINEIKKHLGCDSIQENPIITQFVNEWRAQMVYLNLPTNTVEEFIASIKTVYNQWLQYTNAQQQAQQMQNQSMFVNVNDLISANNALNLENEQNKAEVKRLMFENADLKARLASLGEQV